MKVGDTITIMLGTKTTKAEVVKINESTVLVELPNGKTIKRHKDKHIIKED